MPTTYLTGYAGKVRTRVELEQWSQWQGLDPEFRRRILALIDASITAGRPLGIGGTIRTVAGQESLFFSRHVEVPAGGCCTYKGKRYKLRPDAAHAAPPGLSYHEPVTTLGDCLAIDFIGNYAFLREHCARYGLNEFSKINNEPWHSQPADIARGRSGYRPIRDDPLKAFPLPPPPQPAATRVEAPTPTIRQGKRNSAGEVRELQALCNFWGWRDALGRDLIVDGGFGAKSEQALRVMQKALRVMPDGVYGTGTARALQAFLDLMARQP